MGRKSSSQKSAEENRREERVQFILSEVDKITRALMEYKISEHSYRMLMNSYNNDLKRLGSDKRV